MPWLVIFTEALRTRGRVLGRPRVLVAYVMLVAMLALTKKTGVYVCGLSALAAVFYLRRDSPRLVAATLGTILAYLVLVESLLFSALGIRPGASSEMLSIPLQQTARYALTHPDDATEQERAAITAVLGDDFYELVEDEYDPAISDPVKALFDNEAPLSDKLAYLGTWLAQGLRHPGTYLAATFANVYEVFYPASLMEQFNDIPAEWHSEEMLELLGVTADAYVPVEDLASTTDTISSPASLASAREAYCTASAPSRPRRPTSSCPRPSTRRGCRSRPGIRDLPAQRHGDRRAGAHAAQHARGRGGPRHPGALPHPADVHVHARAGAVLGGRVRRPASPEAQPALGARARKSC